MASTIEVEEEWGCHGNLRCPRKADLPFWASVVLWRATLVGVEQVSWKGQLRARLGCKLHSLAVIFGSLSVCLIHSFTAAMFDQYIQTRSEHWANPLPPLCLASWVGHSRIDPGFIRFLTAAWVCCPALRFIKYHVYLSFSLYLYS